MKFFKTGLLTSLAIGSLSCAAGAYAQSSVELYGLIGVTAGTFKHSGGPASAVQLNSGGLTTSYFGIRGSEDIGGGNKIIFGLESFFLPTTGAQGRTAADPFLSRAAWVGISSGYGQLTLGRQTNPTYLNMQLVNPFGSSTVFSPIVLQSFVATFGNSIIGDTVWNNAIEYKSPNIAGFTGTAIYGVGGIAGENGIANLGLHGTYVKGPVTAVISAQRVRQPVTAPTTEQYAYLGGLAYNFNILKVYGAALTTNTHGISVGTHTYELGLSVPVVGHSSILAEWARTSRNGGGGPKTSHTTASIGYDYALSKRTDVYVVGMMDKLSTAATADTAALGLRHSF